MFYKTLPQKQNYYNSTQDNYFNQKHWYLFIKLMIFTKDICVVSIFSCNRYYNILIIIILYTKHIHYFFFN